MENKLISIGERNIQLDKKYIKSKTSYEFFAFGDYHSLSIQYTEFCHTPLNISQFVPAIKVGDKWEVLEEPKEIYYQDVDGTSLDYYLDYQQYQTAKDNVIFSGFEVKYYNNPTYQIIKSGIKTYSISSDGFWDFMGLNTIQDLIKYNPTLTIKGLEDSGLNR